MRKFVIALFVVSLVWVFFLLEGKGGGNAAFQPSGNIKICRVYKLMTMEGGLCQWYCWQCDAGPPTGEVNSCTVGPGGCIGSYGCFEVPPQAPAPKAPPPAPSPKAPPVPDDGAFPAFAFFGSPSGQKIDPNNNVGKMGLKKLKKKPTVTENDGTVIDRAVLRFRPDESKPWRKAYVCLVKYDPPAAEKPCLILGCGREIAADTPDTPHDLESMQIAPLPDLPYLVEITAGAVTYVVALHEDGP